MKRNDLATVATPHLVAWATGMQRFADWKELGLPEEFEDHPSFHGTDTVSSAEEEMLNRGAAALDAILPLMTMPLGEHDHHPWPMLMRLLRLVLSGKPTEWNRDGLIALIRTRATTVPETHADWTDYMTALVSMFCAMAPTPRIGGQKKDSLCWKSDPLFAFLAEALPPHPSPNPSVAEPMAIDVVVYLLFEAAFMPVGDPYGGDRYSKPISDVPEENRLLVQADRDFTVSCHTLASEETRPLVACLPQLGWPLMHAVWFAKEAETHERRRGRNGLPEKPEEIVRLARLSIFLRCLITRVHNETWARDFDEFAGISPILELLVPCLGAAPNPNHERDWMRAEMLAQSTLYLFGTASAGVIFNALRWKTITKEAVLSAFHMISRTLGGDKSISDRPPVQTPDELVNYLLGASLGKAKWPNRREPLALEALRVVRIPAELRADVRECLMKHLASPEKRRPAPASPEAQENETQLVFQAAVSLQRCNLQGAVSSREFRTGLTTLSALCQNSQLVAEYYAAIGREDFIFRRRQQA